MQIPQRLADDFKSPLRGSVDHIVKRTEAIAKELLKADAMFRQPCKDKATVVLDSADILRVIVALGVFMPGVLAPLFQRNRAQTPVGFERSCKMGVAEKLPGIALPVDDDLGAFVWTTIV